VIALRVLHRGRVVREQVFPELPVTIGRGPGSGFVLADRSVSRQHARVERTDDGQLRLVDLGSRNGLNVGRGAVQEIPVERRAVCRVGRVVLEVEPVSDAPTLEVDAREWRRLRRRRTLLHPLLYLLGGVAGAVLGTVIEPSFWSPSDHTRWVGLVTTAFGIALGLSFLAGALFVVLKALGRQVTMADTMRAVALLTWLGPAVSLLTLAAYYPLASSAFSWLDGITTTIVITAAVVTLASVRREPLTVRFVLGWAGGTLLLIAAMTSAWGISRKQDGPPNVDLRVQAPVAGYAGRAGSFGDYLEDVRDAANLAERAADASRARTQVDRPVAASPQAAR
jgi:FHA domain-containing protein/Yip1-like protein